MKRRCLLEPNRALPALLGRMPVCVLHGTVHRPVRSLSMDARQVTPGALFVAVHGHHSDGHVCLNEALDRGATVLVVEEMPVSLWPRVRAGEYTVLQVADSRKALALLASAYYGHPARHLRLVGVTGTNGKTTITYIVEAILQAAGHTAGVLGTVNYRFGTHYLPAPQTTPDVLVLHQLLAQMVEAGIGDAVIEVSSPALMQERVWGCRFEAAVFTNMCCGRYDDHGSGEASWAVKARLLRDMAAAWHIVNLDDPCGQKLVQTSQARLLTYGLDHEATLKPSRVSHGLDGIRFTLATTKGRLTISSPLVGRHNVYNLLAGIGVALALDIEAPAIRDGIAQLQRVPGRLERIDVGQDFAVFVDCARTPTALEQILRLLRTETTGRVITVFGGDGGRDPGERPLLGEVVTALSDYTIITSDHPRTEDPQQIIAAIVAGVNATARYTTIPDRRQAIEQAIALAQAQDTVVIAGKGHEDYHIVGQQRLYFDDREVARAALQQREVGEKHAKLGSR